MAPSTRSGLTEERVRDLIAEAIGEAIPDIVVAIRDQLTGLIEERIAAIPAATGQTRTREFQYRDFSACSPPEFKGATSPIVCLRWLSDIEGAFLTSGCPQELRVRFVRNLLRDGAKDWWGTWTATMTPAQVMAITWEDFVTRFRAEYVPRVEVEKISRDFLSLEQTTESIPELNRKFTEMALFCPQYAASEEMKMTRYLDMLRTDIREFVSTTPYTTLASMMEAARRRELELETQARKRKAAQAMTTGADSAKKPKVGDTRQGHQSARDRTSGGTRRGNGHACLKCGKVGHLARDCRSGLKVCFNCGKPGHIRPDCPDLKTGGGSAAPVATVAAPPLLTGGRAGPARQQTTRARVHQLTAEEAQTAPAVVAGIS